MTNSKIEVSNRDIYDALPETARTTGSTILMTGAFGGIGQQLSAYLLAQGTAASIIPISRRSPENSPINSYNLTTEVPDLKNIKNGENEPVKIDWIVHLATTCKVEEDLQMLRNLLQCAEENNISNFLYMSSWVVHFPEAYLHDEYIKMKRQCEQFLSDKRNLPDCIKTVQIIRPSVVIGKGLAWSNVLTDLSAIAPIIPKAFTRSFLSIKELNQTIESIINHNKISISNTENLQVLTLTLLGQRASLSEKAAEHAPSDIPSTIWKLIKPLFGAIAILLLIWSPNILGISREIILCLFAITYLLISFYQKILPLILAKISDYLAGFFYIRFEPETEVDILALVDCRNSNIRIRGYDNARLYFRNPNSSEYTTISLKKFNKILSVDTKKMTIRVQSGTHFAQLLPYLEQQGLWLDNYPNYHFISIGACILTAVHGSSLSYSFIADLVTWIRYYDRQTDKIIEIKRDEKDFSQVIFNTEKLGEIVILEVELKVCKRTYYRLTSEEKELDELRFDDLQNFVRQEQHYEVRVNKPYAKKAYLQSYEEISDATSKEGLLDIKADRIGSIWNVMQKNKFNSWLSSNITQQASINYEWFFQPEDFTRFWAEIRGDRQTYRMYKLLIRYNAKREDVNTPYHGTISIDIEIPVSRAMIECSKQLFLKYRPLEHQGKYSIEKNHIN
ncbi:MAG: FAD-binding protein [Limnothrix sp. RL_2_0]|nr:FAD-binding protein [Limnothrix sp. RL_2_0]